MVFQRLITKASTERNVAIAGFVFFTTYAILLRTNAAFFPENPLAFATDFSLPIGYLAEDIFSAEVNPLVLVAVTIVNLVSTVSLGFLQAATIAWAHEAVLGAGKTGAWVMFPYVNVLHHSVESVLCSGAILTDNEDYADLASFLALNRTLFLKFTLLVTAIAAFVFARGWSTSIGRDGRQKIEKKDKKQ
ncbi:hypothetical protein HDU79_005275 [Rhizoclosmatium sp. JEL0117]|nr:hypothetical protein HDU79_005275 [Rhizoclosmatium sp. JEL0117]